MRGAADAGARAAVWPSVALFAACHAGYAVLHALLANLAGIALEIEIGYLVVAGASLLALARLVRRGRRLPTAGERRRLLLGCWLVAVLVSLAGYVWVRWQLRATSAGLPLPWLQLGVPLLLKLLLIWACCAPWNARWLRQHLRQDDGDR